MTRSSNSEFSAHVIGYKGASFSVDGQQYKTYLDGMRDGLNREFALEKAGLNPTKMVEIAERVVVTNTSGGGRVRQNTISRQEGGINIKTTTTVATVEGIGTASVHTGNDIYANQRVIARSIIDNPKQASVLDWVGETVGRILNGGKSANSQALYGHSGVALSRREIRLLESAKRADEKRTDGFETAKSTLGRRMSDAELINPGAIRGDEITYEVARDLNTSFLGHDIHVETPSMFSRIETVIFDHGGHEQSLRTSEVLGSTEIPHDLQMRYIEHGTEGSSIHYHDGKIVDVIPVAPRSWD